MGRILIALVIVSHSPKIADGVKELADEMAQGKVNIYAAGGVDDTTIGTNAERIHAALQEAVASADGVLLLVDMGSAAMSAEMAVEMLDAAQQAQIVISEAPLVEGAVIAAVEASIGSDLQAVSMAADQTRHMSKLP